MPKFILVILSLLPFSLIAQTDTLGNQLNNANDFQISLQKTTKNIVVDGILDENEWSIAKPAKDFWMKYPDNKERAKTKTEVRMTYDDHNLYIGVVCFDSSSKHVIPTLKRDVNYFDGDGIAVVLDPVNQKSNAYLFGVSPLGVQSEATIQAIGDPSWSWDAKWVTETKQYVDRWTVEMAIPFKSLRYEAGKTTWGINFIRNDVKHGQYDTWARIPLQFFGYSLGYYGSLNWDAPPPVEKGNVALIPYVLTGTSKDFENKKNAEPILRGGMDAKIALTSQLNLDATINPDFSQVDVDDQVTNLTRFNIFYPEKRTFFLENSDVLSELGSMGSRPFFSRRIGLDGNANRVPILFGARLSGNLNKKLRINAFDMQTGKTDGQAAYNYGAAAIQQGLIGRSFFKLGLLNKQNIANNKDYTRDLSAELSFTSKNNNLDAWLMGHHALHPDLKDKNDFKETGFWYHNDRWQFLVDLTSVGTNYFTGMAYFERLENYDALTDKTRRIGYKQAFTFGNYKYIPQHSEVIAQNEVMLVNAHVLNPDNTFNNNNLQLMNTLGFKNTARLMVSLTHEDSQLPVYLDFSGKPYLPPSRYQFTSASAQFSSDIRQAFTYVATVKAGQFYNGNQFTLIGGLNYRLTPLGQLGVAIERYDLQFPEPYKRSLLYLIKSKAELSFTKNLIWTTFLQYNTQADNFNINSRLQWRYKPMSDLFIVYSDNYGTNDPFQAFLKKNRALVLKMNYWFNL